MHSGIRAELTIDAPEGCPVATATGRTRARSHSVSRSVSPDDPDRVTEEFVLDAGPDDVDVADAVFSYGDDVVYRFERERGRGCPCERIERHDCPVADVHSVDDRLHLAFHAPDMDRLRSAIASVRERYPDANVRRLLRADAESSDDGLVFVDRSALTGRQREVLETAHEMGYFAHPKEANAGEVADALGVHSSTFSEHLAAAQRKLLSNVLDA